MEVYYSANEGELARRLKSEESADARACAMVSQRLDSLKLMAGANVAVACRRAGCFGSDAPSMPANSIMHTSDMALYETRAATSLPGVVIAPSLMYSELRDSTRQMICEVVASELDRRRRKLDSNAPESAGIDCRSSAREGQSKGQQVGGLRCNWPAVGCICIAGLEPCLRTVKRIC